MRPFAYERATDVRSAVAACTAGMAEGAGAVYLGGGTNLVDLMRLGVVSPGVLVDVTRLPFDGIEETADGGLLIGAGVRNSDLAAHPLVRRRYPMLTQAVVAGASGQIRNMATVGGNLLQRTRCSYFQDVTKPCNKRVPGSGCPARSGDHRNLAVIGQSEACVATHPSDMAVPLAALGAVVHIEGPGGSRQVPMPGFHRLPGDAPERDTVLEPGDLVTAVEVPPLPFATRSRYRKVRDRASFAFAVVSVAAALDVEAGMVRDCRIALGGVAHVPWRAERAESALRGSPATEAAFAQAAAEELARTTPLPHNAFKVPLARNVVVRTLLDLVEAS
jgi:xanthine dehydrogenase YagS FAD-binding subunit